MLSALARTLLLLFLLKKFEGLEDRLPGAVLVPLGDTALEVGRDFVSLLRCRVSVFETCPGPVRKPRESGPFRPRSPIGLGARVDISLDGAVMFGDPECPFQWRGVVIPDCMPEWMAENRDVVLFLCLDDCFWL